MLTLTALPQELLLKIVSHTGIERHDASCTDSRSLACFARTCKMFHGMCEPLLYNSVHCDSIITFVRTLIGNPRLASMVKELHIDDIAMTLGLTTTTINGKVYDLHEEPQDHSEEEQGDGDEEEERFQPQRIEYGTIWKLSPEDVDWLIAISGKVLSNPCKMEPPNDAESEDSMFCLLQTLACIYCPNLEKLRIPIDLNGNDLRELKDSNQTLFPNLISFNAEVYAEEFFSPMGDRISGMLAKAPKLERVNLQGIDGLEPAFRSSSLKELHMNVSGINLGAAESLFPGFPNLERFMYDIHGGDMGNIEEQPVALFNSLQRNCKKLQYIRFTWDSQMGEGSEFMDEEMDGEDEEGAGPGAGASNSVIQSMGGMSSLRELSLHDGCTAICYVEGDATATYKKFFPPNIEKIWFNQTDGYGGHDTAKTAPAFALTTLAEIARTHYPHLKLVDVWCPEGKYNKEELKAVYRAAGIEFRMHHEPQY